MGWLSERFPLINQRIEGNVELLPVFDNMYLDANGIVHTCSHPNDEDVSTRLSMEEMVLGMMAYINKMVHTIRPRKLLFVAIDGCAPRAKMNQQRSRRFASARDAKIKRDEAVDNGELTLEDSATMFDSNVITPGTAFMAELSVHFEFFLRKKVKEDPLWSGLEIIYSGHDVPGEGEHKIMDYIRHTRMQPGYDANTRHCLCGLDADLIMLGLASHEPHFSLLREEVDFNAFRNSEKKNATKQVKQQTERDKWQLLHLSSLRSYLELEFCPAHLKLDLERVIDDWVFMVMLVGNDFLPHLPSLDIAEGALDTISRLYKELLPTLGGYLVEDNIPQWDRVEVLLRRLGDMEESVLEEREQEQLRRQQQGRRRGFGGGSSQGREGAIESKASGLLEESTEETEEEEDPTVAQLPSGSDNLPFSERKLGYYKEKFGVDDADAENEIVGYVVRKYKEGLEWCLQYYYQGVPSWTWFYPFHFAPMASDLVNLSSIPVTLELGAPFSPFMQLLSCLPAASAHCLPACYRALMTDPDSPIADFYPTEWNVDENGKTSTWLFVNLLPFIDEQRLREAVSQQCPDSALTDEERARNRFGHAKIIRPDPTSKAPLPSTLKALRSLDESHTTVSEYVLPAIERNVSKLLPGVHSLPGDPQLSILVDPSMCELESVELDTFGARPSKKATFCLGLRDSPVTAKMFLAKLKPRSTVWVDFPYLREALVVAVSDEDERIEIATGSSRHLTANERNTFRQDAAGAQSRALKGAKVVGTGGIYTGEVKVLVLVKPLCAMVEDRATGLRSRSFHASAETWVPAALCSLDNPLPDARFQDTPAIALTLRFPVGMPVLCVQSEGYGMLGTVEGHAEHSIVARFPAKMAKPVEFGHVIATSMVDTYVSLSRAAQSLGISPAALDKIFGSVLVMPGRLDLGLNLRVGGDKVLPGYCRTTRTDQAVWVGESSLSRVAGFEPIRKHHGASSGYGGEYLDASQFEYSARAIELAAKYKEKFPHLVESITKRPNEREYRAFDLLGKSFEKELLRVGTWLQQIPTYKMGLIPSSSKVLSRDAIVAIEAAADRQTQKEANAEAKSTVLITLPAHSLLRPPAHGKGFIESPSAHHPPTLGDRVANVGSPTVPFGFRGTVVAVHPNTGNVEVVFDLFFVDGTSLHGMCSRGKGFFMPWAHLLSLSRKAPVDVEPPARLAPQAPASSTPSPFKLLEVKPGSAAAPQGEKKSGSRGGAPPQPLLTPVVATPQATTTASSERAHKPKAPAPQTPLATTPAVGVAAATKPIIVSSAPATPVDDLAEYWKQLMSKTPLSSAAKPFTPPAAAATPSVPLTIAKPPPTQQPPSSGTAPAPVATPAAMRTPGPVLANPSPVLQQPVLVQSPAPIAQFPVVVTRIDQPKSASSAAKPSKAVDALDALVRRAHQTEGRNLDGA